jgi:peptidoglycan/xylan/chitin deacetylase (PgdA/CDA1 family)
MRWLSLVGVMAAATLATAAPDPMPPEAPAAHAGSAAGSATTAGAAAKPKSSDDDLAALTDDPVLGRGSRVNGDEVSGVVAFTFDDGPNPETTPAVIDALEQYDIPATFFIVTQRLLGKHGEKSRELLQRELAGGFMVGSHSVTHPNLKHAAGAQITKEIDNSFRTLSKEAGRPIGLFRPPYGALSGAGRMRLKKLGVTEVIWSVDTLDWKAKNADRLRKKVLAMIIKQNGGVVLMHDVKPITARIIGEVLDDLEAENCKRLEEKKDPIIPVSLHYFLHEGKTVRPVPADVQKRTDAYKLALPVRCANRLVHAPEGTKAAAAATVPSGAGDFGRPDEKPRPPRPSAECLNNPLAPGCH